MRRRRLITQIFPVYLGIILLSLCAVAVIATRTVRDFYYDQTSAELEAFANLVRLQVAETFPEASTESLDSLSEKLGRISSSRVTIIKPDGTVIGDTNENPGLMENHADRPEIRQALAGKTGISTRFSPTLKDQRMYLAIPLQKGGKIVVVVRVSRSVGAITEALNRVYHWIAVGGLIVALIAAMLIYWISKRISKPLEEMRQGAVRFGTGDLASRLMIPDSEELGQLAETLNDMAEQLRDRISTITKQHNEMEAVLVSMVEGVVAVNNEERIISLNHAAGKLLEVDVESAKGRSVQEAILNPDFQNFVTRVLGSTENIEDEITIQRDREMHLRATGTHLHDGDGKRIGVLVVLNDVTRLHQLEDVRREFVANVSHELRTPITTIQGFVETLKDGALHDPENAEHFLDIIAKHVDRLNAIIEDLLSLSKIEREAEADEILLKEGNISGVVKQAVLGCQLKADGKNVTIEILPSDESNGQINAILLEQALINLLDNAINYSEDNGSIKVGVEKDEDEITIYVQDFGCGIESEQIPRLFERFYRVDKDRSRKLGGTGLGLAIVKHIVLAHHGRVSVDSTPGEGSIFRIHLPKS